LKAEKGISYMRLIIFSIFLIFVAVFSLNAFQKGENQVSNSTFDSDNIGEVPADWQFISGG